MKLSEKIYYCRKKAGKSQEALAETLGVSRQAVSKWETGDAEPEISKLKLLANTFGVTVDWLLSEEEPDQQDATEPPKARDTVPEFHNWVDSIPGAIGKLLRRYGWLAGVYLAVSGAGFTLIGTLTRVIAKRMFSSMDTMTHTMMGELNSFFPAGTIIYDEFGNQLVTQGSSFSSDNPVVIMGSVIMAVGIIMIIAGTVLALVLHRQSKHH